jgi:hypothetical protein
MSPTQRASASVFYSYSHGDERLRDDLADALALLNGRASLPSGTIEKLQPGTNGGKASTTPGQADIILCW